MPFAFGSLLLWGGADEVTLFTIGRIARQLVFKTCSTCFAVRKTRSNDSRNVAAAKPSNNPSALARNNTLKVLGLLAPPGALAALMTRASVIGNDCCWVTSM